MSVDEQTARTQELNQLIDTFVAPRRRLVDQYRHTFESICISGKPGYTITVSGGRPALSLQEELKKWFGHGSVTVTSLDADNNRYEIYCV